MKTQFLFILSVLFLVSSFSNASSYLGKAPESGFIISVNPAKVPSVSGESVLIKGTVKYVKKSHSGKSSKEKDDDDRDDKDDKKLGLLEKLKAQGIEITGSFPSSVMDISSGLNLKSISDSEIEFSYLTNNLVADDQNQFSIKVYNNHTHKNILKKLLVIQAKLDKRVQLLAKLKQKHEGQKSPQQAISVIEKEIAKLNAIITKISSRINSNENLMAEHTYALQVDNLTSNYSKISTVMNNFRFMVNSDIGSAIHGMKVNLKSQIVNLSRDHENHNASVDNDDEEDDNDDDHDDEGYLAEFYFNDQKISSQKIFKERKHVDIVFDYPTEKLNPANANIFSVALYELDDGKKERRIGYLNYKLPVIQDSVKPVWLSESVPNHQDRYTQQMRSVNLKAQDSFGRIDPTTFKVVLNSQGTTKDLSGPISNTKFADGVMYEFTGDINPLEEGEYTLTAKISDLAGNLADDYSVIFRIDRTAPVVNTTLADNTLTNKTSIEVPITVSDLSPTATDVYVNNELAMTSGLKDFSANVKLNLEGNNTIRIESKDAAGNVAISQEVVVVRDTTPPILTITLPKENDFVNGIQFNIQAQTNESVQLAKVNNQSLTIGSDKKSISGTFTSLREGPLMLNFEATDLAGNSTYKIVNVNVVLKALNPELLSIVADPKTNTLIVKGAAGATRPGVTVKASANIFNSGEALGNVDGAFAIVLEPFSEVEVSAYDPIIDKTEKVTLKFGVSDGTLLAGTVRDIDGQPLMGAKVSLVNTNISVTTDENGIFRFTQAMTGGKLIYGDQNLFIDGTTIVQATGEDKRKFSIVQLPITISLNQTNVLQRSIYLAPIILDGSETPITISGGGVVTSPHAPGVALNIPADSVAFPSGAVSAPISMQEITSERSTILPIAAAMPKTVVALEPSGATFSKPVELTLPNKNAFSPSAELVILLMNSKTGKWEVGGAATVSPDGGSIVTKPGQGIRHFSLAYAAPVGPTVRAIGAKDKPGANTFDGAASTKVSIPTFKALGETMGAGLVYKSSWAKPTALVTNLFDMSTRKVEVTVPTTSGSLVDKVKVNLPYCSVKANFIGIPDPDSFKCTENIQEFLYDIQYKISYKNTYSVMKPDKIEATFQTANLKSPVMTFTGVPDMAAISYATELKQNDSQEYFTSGIYPYTAHYDLHFKEITVGTRVVEQKVNLGEPQISEEAFSSDEIQRVFPQDLSEPLYVQNYTKSEAGRGWRIEGIQKIVNPTGDRIMIEEESGEIATYSLANTISTVADLNGKADLAKGVGLNKWPLVQYMDTSANQYKQLDLTTNTASIMAAPYAVTGTVAGFDFYNYTYTHVWRNWECLRHKYRVCVERGWKYYYDYYPKSSCAKNAYSYSIASKPSHFLMAQNGEVYGLDYGRSSVFVVREGASSMVGGKLTATQTFINNYQAQKTETNQQILNYCNSVDGMNCNQTLSYYNGAVDGTTACGPGVFSSGYVPDTSDLNNPMGMTAGLTPNTLVIADSGHHQVKILDLSTGQSQVIAGTGKVADSGEGIQATQADIFYPRGLVYDKYGNLYISSKAGLIRRIDTLGNISTVAGDPTNGQILDDGDAKAMKLNEPYGMVIDHTRNFLYVAETGAHRVLRIDLSNGQAKTVAGNRVAGFSGDGKSALEASLNSPTHLGLDNNGNLLIADGGNQRIRRVIFQSASTGHLAFKPTVEDNSNLFRNSDGTWSRVYRNGTIVYYDSFGRQLSTIDRVGRTKEISYDTLGRLTQIKNPVGQIISYSYSGDKLVSITDPAQRVTEFHYNFEGFLTKVNYPDGTSTSYEYSPDGLLIAEFNQRNAKTQYQYNVHNRLEKVIKPDNSNIQIADSGSQTTAEGEMKSISNVDNVVTDSNGNKTTVEKDFMGYIHTITDAEGRVTKLKRDFKGRTVEIQRPDGTILKNAYDQITGDLLKITDTGTGESVETLYDQFGNVVKKIDSKGYVYTNVYSPTTGLLTKATAPGNKESSYQYNQLGLLISRTVGSNSQNPLTTTFEYNSQGLISKLIVPDGTYTIFKYDSAGNAVETTTMKNSLTALTTKYFYNNANRLIKVITPNSEVTEYSYLATGELSQIKDAKEKLTLFGYDIMGRVIKKTNQLGFVYEMKYDPNGNLVEELDPNGNVKKHIYSGNNKLKQSILPDDLVTYLYDEKGEIRSVENKNSKVVYGRDAKDRVTSAQVTGLNALGSYPSVLIDYAYDANGNLTEISTNVGTQRFEYDELNRVSQIQSAGGSVFSFAFDDSNQIKKILRPGSQTDYVYSGSGNIEQIIHSSNQVTRSFVQYSYDQSSYPIQKRGPSGTMDYQYDLNGQLTGVVSNDVSKNESFSYDFIGNRITDQNGNYIYDQTSQLLKEDYQYFYSYDGNGNLITKLAKDQAKDSFSFTYSSSNQLTGIRTFGRIGDPIKKEVIYSYDVLGRRMQKQVIDSIDSAKSYTRKYVYNGENIFAEFDGSNNILARYAYSPLAPDDILEVEISSYGVQGGLAQSTGRYQYLKDHLGSVTDITDANGNIVQRYEYSAYGKIMSIKDNSGNNITVSPVVNSSFTYTGREYDSESGLYYNRARYYDANIGRFLQQDPNPGVLGVPITFVNKYVYASNSPTIFRDPTGKDFFNDIFQFMGSVILTAIAIQVTIFDLAIGVAGAILGLREWPKLHIEEDGWTVENSFFADVFDSASWGPAIFLSSENEYGGMVWKHEYGHRLQYQDWGGMDYMGFMVERFVGSFTSNAPPDREMDADKRATDYFGTPICSYPSRNHPVPACRTYY